MKRVIGMVAAALVVAGCQASSGGAGKTANVKVDLAPNLDAYTVQQLAVFTFTNTSGNPDAELMYNAILQAMGSRTKYAIMTVEEFGFVAKRVGVEADLERVVGGWRNRRLIDQGPLGNILKATDADAAVFMDVKKWESVKLDPNQEGTSNTTVGLTVEMYAPDGTLLWAANHTKLVKSASYNPDFNVRSTIAGEARMTSAGAVPDPPKIEKVAVEAAEEAVATMPNLTGFPAPTEGATTP